MNRESDRANSIIKWEKPHYQRPLQFACDAIAMEEPEPEVANRAIELEADADAEQKLLASGAVIAGRYKILSELGRGGMGVVYKVDQIYLRQIFALKVLNSAESMRADSKRRSRFEKEARASSRLNHPNLTKVHDFDVLDGDVPFFVMDYLEGTNLAKLISERGQLPYKEALDIFIQICDGLAYAHEHGIIHRDLKPSNIMIVHLDGQLEGGTVKIVDFGIARIVHLDPEEGLSMTRTGEIFGSPFYMSPEQCLGQKVDNRSDLYSLGCTLFEALTGLPPFSGESALVTMMKHQSEEPLSLKEATLGQSFPSDLEKVLKKLLAKKPEERYQSASDIKRDLELIRSGQSISAQPQQRASKSYLVPFAVAATLCVILAGSLVFSLLSAKKEERRQPVQELQGEGEYWLKSPEVPDHPFADVPLAQARARGGPWVFHFPHEAAFGEISQPDENNNFIDEKLPGRRYLARDEVKLPSARPIALLPVGPACRYPTLFKYFRDDEVAHLYLYYNPDANDDLLFFVKHWKGLKLLKANDSSITDEGLSYLTDLPSLVSLSVSNTRVTGGAICKLHNLHKLHELHMTNLQDVLAVVDALKNSTNLTVLSVRMDHLTDNDADKLAKLPALQTLSIDRNEKMTDRTIEKLTKLKQIRTLTIYGLNLSPKVIPHLKQFPHLSELFIDVSHWSKDDIDHLKLALPKCHLHTDAADNAASPNILRRWGY